MERSESWFNDERMNDRLKHKMQSVYLTSAERVQNGPTARSVLKNRSYDRLHTGVCSPVELISWMFLKIA